MEVQHYQNLIEYISYLFEKVFIDVKDTTDRN